MNTIQTEQRTEVTTNEGHLSFNEWSEKLKVSSRYVEPTKYFQGNPSSGFTPLETKTFVERFMDLFSSK